MSMAPTAYLLFHKWLRHDPSDPNWTARDRFVLSMGHSSLTLYVQLYLSGYGLELEDLQALRTWGSKTPGHPEVNHTPGVETTTGPLGQGVGNAVGMAMAARRERGMLDPDAPEGESLFDHTVWCFASDGDMEEGVSGEASSLAGTQQLGNLVLVYDDNRISIEDDTTVAFTEDVGKRYEAYGWHVQHVDDGEDLAAVDAAFAAAKAETGRPRSSCCARSSPGRRPNKQNTGAAHGSALGEDEVRATKEILGFDPEQTFEVDDEVLAHARSVVEKGREERAAWDERFAAWQRENADAAALLERMRTRTLPEGFGTDLPSWDADPKGVATRKASGRCSPRSTRCCPSCGAGRRPGGEQQHRGQGRTVLPARRPPDEDVVGRAVRTHAALRRPGARDGRDHERDRPARRHPRSTAAPSSPSPTTCAARCGWPRSCSCRSPTSGRTTPSAWARTARRHQPIEHFAALRAIPGLDVVRPADANEVAVAWRTVLENNDRPAGLLLSRQNLPSTTVGVRLRRGRGPRGLRAGRGLQRHPEVILLGTGSEVQIAVAARERLEADGVPTRVVSVPCVEWFADQDQAYKDEVLPPTVRARVSVEAGVPMGGASSSATPAGSSASPTTGPAPPTPSSTSSSASPTRPWWPARESLEAPGRARRPGRTVAATGGLPTHRRPWTTPLPPPAQLAAAPAGAVTSRRL
jgi:transketolase